MKATVTFSSARIYDVNSFMVLTNQGFNVKLDPENESFGELRWFADNDPALTIEVKEGGMEANITSDKPGKAKILIMNSLLKVAKELNITVVEVLPVEADILEIKTEILDKP